MEVVGHVHLWATGSLRKSKMLQRRFVATSRAKVMFECLFQIYLGYCQPFDMSAKRAWKKKKSNTWRQKPHFRENFYNCWPMEQIGRAGVNGAEQDGWKLQAAIYFQPIFRKKTKHNEELFWCRHPIPRYKEELVSTSRDQPLMMSQRSFKNSQWFVLEVVMMTSVISKMD